MLPHYLHVTTMQSLPKPYKSVKGNIMKNTRSLKALQLLSTFIGGDDNGGGGDGVEPPSAE